jgi:hypothetical protein
MRQPGCYFFFTRDPPELRPALLRPALLRPALLRPALEARGDEREADLPREAVVARDELVPLVEVVLTERPEVDLTRLEDAVLRAGE